MTDEEQIATNIRFIVDPYIKHVTEWIARDLKEFAHVDQEEYIHSNEFVNGFKKETVYRSWHSEALVAKIEAQKEDARRLIKVAEQEKNNTEKLKMSLAQYRRYFAERIQTA